MVSSRMPGVLVTDYAAFCCGFHVYVVVADGHVCDDLEGFTGRVHNLCVYSLGNRAEDSGRSAGGF